MRDGADPADPVRIVSIGRAVSKKGFDDLIQALAALPADLHWRFAHVGGGDLLNRLKAKAQQAGNLKSSEQQNVVVEQAPQSTQTVIKIEPTNPETVYVPAYNPTVVYGAWAYPSYPPYYYPPPPMYYPGGALASSRAIARRI